MATTANWDFISTNPLDRVPKEMLEAINDPETCYDIHCHIFDHDYIPDKYFGIRLPFLANEMVLTDAQKILNDLNFMTKSNELSRFANFIRFARATSMEDNANYLFANSPKKNIFAPLLMDMFYGIGGNQRKDYYTQMDEMKTLRDKYPDKLLPFVAIDPNNPDALNIFRKAFSADYNFFGVKIYPALGYLPSHPVLMDIFSICEQKNIPVTTHCGGYAVHSTKSTIKIDAKILNSQNQLIDFSQNVDFYTKAQYGDFFNKPDNWEPVLQTYPKLKLNFGHFGGDEQWTNYANNQSNTWPVKIMDMMHRYDNVYTDISYMLYLDNSPKTKPVMDHFRKILDDNQLVLQRTLFGTDFFMVETEEKYHDLRTQFIIATKDVVVKQIQRINPQQFLFGM